jgi:hypothetical protein
MSTCLSVPGILASMFLVNATQSPLQIDRGDVPEKSSDKYAMQQNVAPGSTIYADGLKSFTGLQQAGFGHIPRIQPLQSDLRKGAKWRCHWRIGPLAIWSSGQFQSFWDLS